MLANLANSGVPWIYVLTQYKPVSLLQHVARVWRTHFVDRGRVLRTVIAPSGVAFRGTADAVCRNLPLLARHEPELVAVFAADHVYRMDIRQMADFHARRAADGTVAAVPVPIDKASQFGIIEAAADGRIVGFQEKPAHAAPMPGDARHAYASMGNYLFKPAVLAELLPAVIAAGGTDFGHHVLPQAVRTGVRLFAYNFDANRVPGLKPYEERAYWRDVGTIEALHAARSEAIGGPTPRFDLRNPEWPLQPRPLRRPLGIERRRPLREAADEGLQTRR